MVVSSARAGHHLARHRKPRAVPQPGYLPAPADAPTAAVRARAPSPCAPRSPALRREFHLRAFLEGRAGGERTGA